MPTSTSPPSGFRGPRSRLIKLLDLAKGGMGTVELGLRREGGFRRLYAVKRLHPHLLDDEDLRAMFVDEARIAGLLRHANVVSVLDVGEDEQGPFLVMDYVDGVTLSAIIQRHATQDQLLPVQLCARVGGEIARGLAVAHELVGHDGERLNIVHRDVSPQNVLVGYDGQVRLADFGIARALGRSSKLTESGVIKGKLGYQAPEQLRFEEATAQSDLFALGVVLYELLSGKRLYKSTPEQSGPIRILQEPPPDIADERSDVPPGLTELLFELLAKRREDRPESARSVAVRLDECVHDLLRDEEPVLLPEYMDRVFGEARRAQAEAVAQAMARLDAGEASESPSPDPRENKDDLTVALATPAVVAATAPALVTAPATRRRGPAIAVIATSLVAALAAIALLGARPKVETSALVAPSSAVPATAEVAAPIAQPSAEQGDPAPAAPTATAVATARSPVPAPARAAGSSRGQRTPPAGIPMWGWK
jgi:eukaryotic-like serine/threonine-protein kinase